MLFEATYLITQNVVLSILYQLILCVYIYIHTYTHRYTYVYIYMRNWWHVGNGKATVNHPQVYHKWLAQTMKVWLLWLLLTKSFPRMNHYPTNHDSPINDIKCAIIKPFSSGGFQKWGYPKNGWFISWKIHLYMDDNYGYPHDLGNLHIGLW